MLLATFANIILSNILGAFFAALGHAEVAGAKIN
jgi:hypothetical protein